MLKNTLNLYGKIFHLSFGSVLNKNVDRLLRFRFFALTYSVNIQQ